MKNAAIIIALLCIAVLAIWVALLRREIAQLEGRPAHTDTITHIRVDTLEVPVPVPYLVEIYDTMYITVDSLLIIDGNIAIPRERKTYKDSNYTAVVSGYRPSLDYLEIYPRTITKTITRTIEPSRWSLSITAGYGVTRQGLSPTITAGVSYSIFNFK